MANVYFECHYCGYVQNEYIYQLARVELRCSKCKSKLTEKNVKKDIEKKDVFGYKKDREYWDRLKGNK